MKTHTTLLALAVLTAFSTARADTAEAIQKEYRVKAAAALVKTNKILETEAATLASSLLRLGSTAEAETLMAQVKQKLAGEPLPSPVPVASGLFKMYDTARAASLQPVKDQFIARISAMTRTDAGQQLAAVTELAKVRAEIEAGKFTSETKRFSTPSKWAFQKTEVGASYGTFTLNPDGTAQMDSNVGTKLATWKTSKKDDIITVKFPDDIWTVTFTDTSLGQIKSSVWTDTRYLKAQQP